MLHVQGLATWRSAEAEVAVGGGGAPLRWLEPRGGEKRAKARLATSRGWRRQRQRLIRADQARSGNVRRWRAKSSSSDQAADDELKLEEDGSGEE